LIFVRLEKYLVNTRFVGYLLSIVGRHFGLDTSGSTWYLSAWSHDTDVSVATRCEQIAATARDLIERITSETAE
jgi:hypothetical protein